MTGTPGDDPLDPLSGQPRMVADPRISVDQATEVLGKTAAQIRRMITLGRLPRRGAPGKFRGLLLSDVLRCRQRGEPINFTAAAELLNCSKAQIRRLIADKRLELVPGTQRWVYENDGPTASQQTPTTQPPQPTNRPTATSTPPQPRRSSAPAPARHSG